MLCNCNKASNTLICTAEEDFSVLLDVICGASVMATQVASVKSDDSQWQQHL
jgi:hypothetical protein